MKEIVKSIRLNFYFIVFQMATLLLTYAAVAQENPYIRIAKIEVDSNQLERYNSALKEHAEAAVKNEKGVLTLYAVQDKDRPCNVTVFEIYQSKDAYNLHLKTAHFLKYKDTVKDMVKSLVLTDVIPVALEAKPDVVKKLERSH